MQRKPYKVIVWGPGLIGSGLIREIAKKPELELVGVLAYSPEKNGKDAGEYIGIEPLGVNMTTDAEEIFRLEADCVLYSPQVSTATGWEDLDSPVLRDICQLLESGKNVISAIGYWHPSRYGEALVKKLEAACEKGNASIHSTGINPGLLNERFMVTMTAACTRIKSILVQEVSDCSILESTDQMHAIGFGLPKESTPVMEMIADSAYGETMDLSCHLLGEKVERIDVEHDYVYTKKDYTLASGYVVPKDTRGCLWYRYTAIVNGKPFMKLEEMWYIDPELCPLKIEGDSEDFYLITVEGEPTSTRAKIDFKASFENNVRCRPGDLMQPAYYATLVSMIQTIPIVCGAKPCIIYPFTFAHYVPDLRDFHSPLIEG